MLADEYLSKDLEEHMIEINDYIMIRVYKLIFSNKVQSKEEYEIYSKIE